jgi:hypothetical protein
MQVRSSVGCHVSISGGMVMKSRSAVSTEVESIVQLRSFYSLSDPSSLAPCCLCIPLSVRQSWVLDVFNHVYDWELFPSRILIPNQPMSSRIQLVCMGILGVGSGKTIELRTLCRSGPQSVAMCPCQVVSL